MGDAEPEAKVANRLLWRRYRATRSGSDEPDVWTGDATVSGMVEEADAARLLEIYEEAPPGPSQLFRADIAELSVVRLGDRLTAC